MVMTDPIADMLTRIRNANAALHETVNIPASRMKAAVLDILLQEGFVKNVEKEENTLKVTLKYGSNNEKLLQELNVFPNLVYVFTRKGRTSSCTWWFGYRSYFHIQRRYERQTSS